MMDDPASPPGITGSVGETLLKVSKGGGLPAPHIIILPFDEILQFCTVKRIQTSVIVMRYVGRNVAH